MGSRTSASLSLGTEGIEVEGGGANVGYLTDVSRRQIAISVGEDLVKSGRSARTVSCGHVPLCMVGRPASSRAKVLAVVTSFIPPKQASRTFHTSSKNFLIGNPRGSRSFMPATIWNSMMGKGGVMATAISDYPLSHQSYSLSSSPNVSSVRKTSTTKYSIARTSMSSALRSSYISCGAWPGAFAVAEVDDGGFSPAASLRSTSTPHGRICCTHHVRWYRLEASLSAITSVPTPSTARTVLAFSITQWSCISGLVVSPKQPVVSCRDSSGA